MVPFLDLRLDKKVPPPVNVILSSTPTNTMTRYNELGKRMEQQLRLNTSPLAIKMLETPDDIPPEAFRPLERFGKCLSTCQVFALSRRFGETVAQLFEDMWCPEPVIGFGLAEPPAYFFKGKTRCPGGVKDLQAGANWAREFPRFESGKYVGVVSAPLTTASFEPDVANKFTVIVLSYSGCFLGSPMRMDETSLLCLVVTVHASMLWFHLCSKESVRHQSHAEETEDTLEHRTMR